MPVKVKSLPNPVPIRGLFTVIMEFAGTTSASQFTAHDAGDALNQWIDKLSEPDVYGITIEQALDLKRSIEIERMELELTTDPVALNGLTHVWCRTFMADAGLCIVHIIHTEA